jgi:hypothetical protein
MKKLYFLVVLFVLTANFSFAQWTTNGSNISNSNSGNVGIGTTSPAAKLDVTGNINVSSYLSSTLGYYMETTGDGINNDPGVGYLSFRSNNVDNRMVIDPNGNVGIGTTNPDQLLTINGTIHAKQVNIDLNVPVPDYVFDHNYKLKTLSEVNRYILVNKHLPEIPSAASMAKEGVNVTELNMKLLQKVEELTLYLIEKDKQVKSQQQQIDIQQQVNTQQAQQLRSQQEQLQSQQQQISLLIKQVANLSKEKSK